MILLLHSSSPPTPRDTIKRKYLHTYLQSESNISKLFDLGWRRILFFPFFALFVFTKKGSFVSYLLVFFSFLYFQLSTFSFNSLVDLCYLKEKNGNSPFSFIFRFRFYILLWSSVKWINRILTCFVFCIMWKTNEIFFSLVLFKSLDFYSLIIYPFENSYSFRCDFKNKFYKFISHSPSINWSNIA